MATAKKTAAPKNAAAEGSRFQARVIVYPRPEILDPQGKAIAGALARLGFQGLVDVRAGKSFALELVAENKAEAEKAAWAMADKLLANTIVETFTVEILSEA